MDLVDIEARTREFMEEEIASDVADGRLYLSPRLAISGGQYADILRAAARAKDTIALANDLRTRLRTHEERQNPKGGTTLAKVPSNAADTLAEGEFNRFYIRALCRRAISEGKKIEVYRAKFVREPRPESQALIGVQLDPAILLADLKTNVGVDTALGVPGGVNSGLSVRLVD